MGDFIEKAFWDCYDYLGEIFYQDYKGQQMQDYVTYFVMSLCTLIGIHFGYQHQQLWITSYFVVGACAFCCLVCCIPWPWFWQRNPVKWQKAIHPGNTKKKD